MRLLWRLKWRNVPAYSVSGSAELLRVAATAPLAAVRDPTGRIIRRPLRKAWTFLLLEGPSATIRKIRCKRATELLEGDYHAVAVLGRRMSDDREVLALCLRAPACAGYLLAHPLLVGDLPLGPSEEILGRFAAKLGQGRDLLERHGSQSYLYSGLDPPPELRELFAAAVGHASQPGPATAKAALHRPPPDPDPTKVGFRRIAAPRAGFPVALLGAGEYARTEIVPAMARAGLRPYAVADREPQIAAHLAETRGFELATTSPEIAIERMPKPGLVVIATAHDSHARLAAAALDAGHRVLLEKPAVVTGEDVSLLLLAARRSPGRLEVGFNRRHHPLVQRARFELARETGPATITCFVREVPLTANHWYLWPNQGTRLTGNLCHWIDLGVMLVGDALPLRISVSQPAATGADAADAERVINVSFDDGSLVTVIATDRGDDIRGVQETIDARRGAVSLMIDDLRTLRTSRDGRRRVRRRLWREKGHRQMYAACLERLIRGQPALYSPRDLLSTCAIQVTGVTLMPTGGTAEIDLPRYDPAVGAQPVPTSNAETAASKDVGR
jgi:predicted dehydrogenase